MTVIFGFKFADELCKKERKRKNERERKKERNGQENLFKNMERKKKETFFFPSNPPNLSPVLL